MFHVARFIFELEPENICVELLKKQLDEMRLVGKEWARFDRARRYRKWRPKDGVKQR